MKKILIALTLLATPVYAQSSAVPRFSLVGPQEPTQEVTNMVLALGVAETVTVPTLASRPGYSTTGNLVGVFGCDPCGFYLRVGGTAEVPTVDITNGTGSMYSPESLLFIKGSTFSVVCSVNCKVTIRWYETR